MRDLFGEIRPASRRPLPPPPDLSRHGIYAGTSGYYFDDWTGVFNPPRIPPSRKAYASSEEIRNSDRLYFYQKYFSFIEINNTFYREPDIGSFLSLDRRTSESVKVSVKLNRSISHSREDDPKTGKDIITQHIRAVSPIMESGKFYSFLLQLDDRVFRTVRKLDYLLHTASVCVKKGFDVHIEFRHISWYNNYVLKSLRNSGIGLCNTDIPPLGHAFPLTEEATSEKGYFRYSGRNKNNWYPVMEKKGPGRSIKNRNARYNYSYSEKEILEFSAGQKRLLQKVPQTAIAYNNHFRAQAVKNASRNLKILKADFDNAS